MPSSKTPGRRPCLVLKGKAEDGDWMAVYDAQGALVGMCDPKNLVRIANPDGSMSEPADQAEAPQPAPAKPAAGDDDAVAKQRRAATLRKSLSGGPIAAQEQAQLAEDMNRAAAVALDIVHGRHRPRRA